MSFFHIQWALLLCLIGVSYHLTWWATSPFGMHIFRLPWHLTFLVHSCIGVFVYWHVVFWYPPHATVSHPYSVLHPLLFSLQTPSSAVRLCRAYVLSRVRLFVTLWTVARQAPLSVGFSRQEYWSSLPFLFFLTQGLKPRLLCLLHWRRIVYLLSHQGSPWLSG